MGIDGFSEYIFMWQFWWKRRDVFFFWNFSFADCSFSTSSLCTYFKPKSTSQWHILKCMCVIKSGFRQTKKRTRFAFCFRFAFVGVSACTMRPNLPFYRASFYGVLKQLKVVCMCVLVAGALMHFTVKQLLRNFGLFKLLLKISNKMIFQHV